MTADALAFIEINGARLRYLDKGNGPTLLLIHGLGASHTDWQKQIDFFARVFRVIAPDLRGHGESQAEGPFNVERFALDCSYLLDELKIGSIFMVGHSMGGAVAMQLALFKPDRVTKMVLADPAEPGLRHDLHRWLRGRWRIAVRPRLGLAPPLPQGTGSDSCRTLLPGISLTIHAGSERAGWRQTTITLG